MNALKLTLAALAGLLVCTPNAFAYIGLPVDDGGLLVVSVAALGAVVGIARWKQKR